MRQCACKECGASFKASRTTQEFCTPACRKVFNNRRAVRGAELYDLVMTWRFDRAADAEVNCRRLICNLASAYRDADKAKRGGRKSWMEDADKAIPLAFSTQGDGR